jgi:signal transduction histidine kinase
MQRIANLRSSYRIRPRTFFFLVVSYFVWASVTLRWITEFIEQDHPLTLLVSALLLLYGLLLGLEPLITGGSATRVHLYLALQTTLVLAAILFHFELDFFALLLLPLCGQAIFLLPRTAAAIWVALLGAANIAGQLQQFGWPQGLPFMLLYSAGFVFVAAFSILILQAEQAHKRSEKLLAELREAHQKLQAFSVQAEELAIANERNRLARDLHDSVAQTLYGLTLQAEAASRKLGLGNLEIVDEYLREIRQNARQTLQEIRLLIFELSPPILQEAGLAAALKARLETVESRSGIQIKTDFPPMGRFPIRTETGLFRIAQEALNNALKHAQASQVQVTLKQDQDTGNLVLAISDNGTGFDTQMRSGGVGLRGMRARADELNGKLWIESEPGQGTRVSVEVPQ